MQEREGHFERIHNLGYIGEEGLARLQRKTVVIFGLGNIGGQTAYHLGLLGIHLILVDCGIVEPVNLSTQGYRISQVGRPKVEAIRSRLLEINPECRIDSVYADFRLLGAAALQADLYVCCLDSLADRVSLNERSWWTQTVWVDAALDGTGRARFGKIAVFDPCDVHSSCYLCAWDSKNLHAALQIERERTAAGRQGCGSWLLDSRQEAPPTFASSSVGGLMASIQSMIAIQVLLANTERKLAGIEFVANFSRPPYGIREVQLNKNDRCISGHNVLRSTSSVTRNSTLAELFDHAESVLHGPVKLWVRGRKVVSRLQCGGCRSVRPLGKIQEFIQREEAICPCGAEMRASGHDLLGSFDRMQAQPFLCHTLLDIGIPEGDLITATNGQGETHFLVK